MGALELPTLPAVGEVSGQTRKEAGKAYTKAQNYFRRNKLVKAQRQSGLIRGGLGIAAIVGGVIWKVMDGPLETSGDIEVDGRQVELTPWNGPHRAGLMLRGTF